MPTELAMLRMLAVGLKGKDLVLLREGVSQAAAPVELVEADGLQDAWQLLTGIRPMDLVVFDRGLPEDDRDMVADIARKAASPAFVVLLTDDRKQDTASATGADAMTSKPADVKAAQIMVDGWVQSQLPRRVMVVDDSPTMRSIVKKILGASRFPLQLAEASEGQAALNVIARSSADIVFLDYNMPGLNGVETLKALKGSNKNVRVVIMTSATDESVATEALDAGADAFLKKPFYPADVDAIIYGLFGLTQLAPAKS
jgi:CheY-like chemotaxis protein